MSQMIEVKVAEAIGPALDWLVGTTERLSLQVISGEYGTGPRVFQVDGRGMIRYRPSTDWSQGGPLMDAHCRSYGAVQNDSGVIRSYAYREGEPYDPLRPMRLSSGPTILIAFGRARVRAMLGDTAMVPAELIDQQHVNPQPCAGLREE
ncbi:phage protein NinX family protein [Pseudomonas sp.]|uniref:phage protein NinX family protein n=1 Tax=Pseudomonas sp. TaxID=306 RepID=UPI00257D1D0B|nr:phage protein NinX family protein [Pseudomonas sp.]